MDDRTRIYVGAFLRATATAMLAVLLGVHLAELRFSSAVAGTIVGAGLMGAAIASLIATLLGDHHGRRRSLVELSLLGAAAALVLAGASHPWTVGIAAFAGMLNGMGRDRGAAAILDQAMIPAVSSAGHRTTAFAVYTFWQDVGHAVGSLMAALPAVLETQTNIPAATANRSGILLYAAILAVVAAIYGRLSPAVEVAVEQGRPLAKVSPATARIIAKLSALFTLDSLGSGFLTTTLLSYFFFERFGVSVGGIGLLFFAARVANAFSHFGAAWLSRRIGLVNTMVFTHLPSSLFLVAVAFAPSFPIAAILFLLRECLVEMDVPTRQSYVVAVVPPAERTLASGATNLVRMAGWAVAPFFAGLFMQNLALAAPLFLGAGMKIAYDLALYAAFRNLKPPEERQSTDEPATAPQSDKPAGR